MSVFTHESMINHHGKSLFSQLAETFHVWRQRYETRRELSKWSERDLRRRRLRTRQAVLAGLIRPLSKPAPPAYRGAGFLFDNPRSVP